MTMKSLGTCSVKAAVERDNVVPYYQPILPVNGKYLGYEALGRISIADATHEPEEFMLSLAEAGLSATFDQMVLYKALRQLSLWRTTVKTVVMMNVNASSEALQDAEYAPYVQDLLTRFNVPPHLLTIEVVETCTFWKDRRILKTLLALHEVGVAIAVDDFPCWSDPEGLLTWLEREKEKFGVTVLKFDRSLTRKIWVGDAETRSRSLAELTRYLTFAKGIGMRVVAEGVEDARDQFTMKFLGASALQGYAIGRPQPAFHVYHLRREIPTPVRGVTAGKFEQRERFEHCH
jgi:EAL domain-containing protein (putative c-di-GMP-specific phosphodiesterase class I)